VSGCTGVMFEVVILFGSVCRLQNLGFIACITACLQSKPQLLQLAGSLHNI